MSLYHEARRDLGVAGYCLLAYRRLEDSEEAEVGALLEAEFFHIVRANLSKV